MPSSPAHLQTNRAPERRAGSTLRQLVSAAADGDEAAWRRIVDELSPLVFSVTRAHGLSECDAADVSQATWCALLSHIDGLREPERIGAWVGTTARRECLCELRHKRRQVPRGEEPPDPDALQPTLDAELLRGERDAALWSAFARLGERDQALLRLLVSDWEPSYEEIAATLGVPIGSVGPTRARALQRLRGQLADCQWQSLIAI
jgi:RNA polymerase sigma factor (sigma-70 family)